MDPKPNAPEGFNAPTALPQSPSEGQAWQNENRKWWQSHPMRYDWNKAVGCEEFSREFYDEIDRRFFGEAWKYMPWKTTPFDALIDFSSLKGKNVLEIGVGNGSHAQLLAAHAGSFTGIDLTDYAVRSTGTRLKVRGLPGTVLQADAEQMPFPDNTFDFIWSWGVIHHSANTDAVLREMARVLRPGGRAVVMVYHRSAWMYYVMSGFFHGVLRGDLFRTRSFHQTMQRHTDGALARYYSIPEWRRQMDAFFNTGDIRIYGAKAEVFPLPPGRFKDRAMAAVPDACSRFLTNSCQFGMFLVASGTVKKPLG